MEAGSRFGSYIIEGFIAAGGMGEVYAARHAVYGSPVAMKVLHAELHPDNSWRRRFNEEGIVGQQLKHPNVLAARELIESDGRIALIMDLVRGGQTLQKVIVREFAAGLPLVQALQAFLGVLQGIEYLHGKGIVHGDIKPENVMLQGDYRKPDTWALLVTDFGTVGLIAHPVIIDGQAAVVASPRYASPEHMAGVDRLEVRSDIYCLGLLLHFLLTGRHASDARSVEEAAIHVSKPLPLTAMVDVPESIIDLVRKCTALAPSQRFSSCRDLALGIRRALDELGVTLPVEDLQADLATELIEERLRLRREQAEREAKAEAADELEDPPSEGGDTDVPSLGTQTDPPPDDLGKIPEDLQKTETEPVASEDRVTAVPLATPLADDDEAPVDPKLSVIPNPDALDLQSAPTVPSAPKRRATPLPSAGSTAVTEPAAPAREAAPGGTSPITVLAAVAIVGTLVFFVIVAWAMTRG